MHPALILFLRLIQLGTIGAIWFGVRQLPKLVDEAQRAPTVKIWSEPSLCVALVKTTAPILIGSALLFLLQVGIHRGSQRRKGLAEHPSEPWLAHPQWAAMHMRLSNRGPLIAFILFVIGYPLIVLPLVWASQRKPIQIFAYIAGFFVLLLFRVFWLNRKWNRSELRISTLPGILGGPFTGVVILHQEFPPGTVFNARLKCEETRLEHRSKGDHDSKTEVLWSSELLINKMLVGSSSGTSAIPVSFAIPYECKATTVDQPHQVRWVLAIEEKDKVSLGGAVFEVPVFKTSESQPNFEFDRDLIQDFVEELDPQVVLRRFNLQITRQDSVGKRFEFSLFESSIFYTFLAIIAVMIGIMGAVKYWVVSSPGFWIGMLIPSLFTALCLYGVIQMLFWKSSIDVVYETNQEGGVGVSEKKVSQVKVESGLPFLKKSLQVLGSEYPRLRCKIANRTQERETWKIELTDRDEVAVELLPMLRGSAEADVVQKWLAEELGIAVSEVRPEDGFNDG